MEKLSEKTVHQWRAHTAPRLTKLKAEAARLGLTKTARALDEATKALGWEIAALSSHKGSDNGK